MALINPFRARARDVVDAPQVNRWRRRNSGLEVPRPADEVEADERHVAGAARGREELRRRLGRDLSAPELALVERLGRAPRHKERRDLLKPYVARYAKGSPRRAFKGIVTPREVLRTMGTMPAPAPVPGRGGRCTDEAKRAARGWGPASEAPLIVEAYLDDLVDEVARRADVPRDLLEDAVGLSGKALARGEAA